jgi:hypothetical protein
MPPANTGNLKISKNAVTHTLTRNKGKFRNLNDSLFKLLIVDKKLIDPAIDLTPAICKLKITISTLKSGCPNVLLKGG